MSAPPRSAASEVGDREPAEFRAGTCDAGVHVATTSEGAEVILRPTVAAEFDSQALPPNWFVEAWKEGGWAQLGKGSLVLDGASAGYYGLYGSERSLEFVATFRKRPHQHVGLGTDFRTVPYITFSTKFGHSLYARSNFLIPEETRLSPKLLGSPHRFRIDWNKLDIDFWVDGQKVAYQLVPLVGLMRPLAANGSLGGGPLELEWLRMTPHRPEGCFVSRIHDAGIPVWWTACDVDADVPADTSLSVEVRAGDPADPNGAWSEWKRLDPADEPLTGNGSLAGRFAQYRARLATDNPSRTPTVRAVTLRYSASSSSASSSSSSSSSSPGADDSGGTRGA